MRVLVYHGSEVLRERLTRARESCASGSAVTSESTGTLLGRLLEAGGCGGPERLLLAAVHPPHGPALNQHADLVLAHINGEGKEKAK